MSNIYIFFYKQTTVQLVCLRNIVVANVTVAIESLAIGQMVYVKAQDVNQDGGETRVMKVCIQLFTHIFFSLCSYSPYTMHSNAFIALNYAWE